MAFNSDEYIDVIVSQIAENFQALEKATKNIPTPKDETEFFLLDKDIKDFVTPEYKTIEPLSVGLFGEWGSGKTHLLKMIEHRINKYQQDEKDIFVQVTIPIFFNAWRFEREEHLIIPLFQTMLAEMQKFEHISFKNKAKKFSRHSYVKMKILSKALFKGLKFPENFVETSFKVADGDIAAIGDIVDIKEVSKKYKEGTKNEFEHDVLLEELLASGRLDSIYYQIPKWIEKITLFDKINFVFLIDDLDRCLPENTLKMLESIKLFLDVPSCAFVLAIDDDVVERGVTYHYRDYLKKDMHKSPELPITGHEYLEKMIQLPFRIPVIDEQNVRSFLEDNYDSLFKSIDERSGDKELKTSEELLDFFAKTIPPKPRKIKRTAMLFETKIKILEELKLPIDYIVVAKITLLELFAPKLLRFIQNNGYRRMFDRLVDFRNLKDEKSENEGSLANSVMIESWIEKYKDTKVQNQYKKMIEIVQESYTTRLIFDLDYIFDKPIDKDILKQNIELKALEVITIQEKKEVMILSSTFMEKLFLQDDETSWRDAFDDNELFAKGEALLDEKQLEEIKNKAKNKKGFYDNPIWLGVVAEYILQEQFIQMLDEIYPYKMQPYTVTFEEYDKYCQDQGIKKPDDKGWGRGKRPVINVSWQDANAYARWLGDEYRLPTSDEWYLACNVGKKSDWHFGDDAKLLDKYAWYDKNSQEKTHPVGELNPNELGLYDMHGNVWEWCEDWYYKDKNKKVLRGGLWDFDAGRSNFTVRYRYIPTYRASYFGFRLLKTLPS